MVGYKKEKRIGTTTAPNVKCILKSFRTLKIKPAAAKPCLFFLSLENSCYLHLLYSRLKSVKAIAMQVLTILIKMHN